MVVSCHCAAVGRRCALLRRGERRGGRQRAGQACVAGLRRAVRRRCGAALLLGEASPLDHSLSFVDSGEVVSVVCD